MPINLNDLTPGTPPEKETKGFVSLIIKVREAGYIPSFVFYG